MSLLATTATLLAGGVLGAALTHRWATARVVGAQRLAIASAVQFAANDGAWHSLNATANAHRRELNVLAGREWSIAQREAEAVDRQTYLDRLGLDTVGALAVLAEAEHRAATRPAFVADVEAEASPMFAELAARHPSWLSDESIGDLIDTVVSGGVPPADEPPADDDVDRQGPAETIDVQPDEAETPPAAVSAELLALREAIGVGVRQLAEDFYRVPAVL